MGGWGACPDSEWSALTALRALQAQGAPGPRHSRPQSELLGPNVASDSWAEEAEQQGAANEVERGRLQRTRAGAKRKIGRSLLRPARG